MKILFAIYLFFLFVFVHGMDEERSGALVGTWKCTGNFCLFTRATKSQDAAHCWQKPFAFFNEDGTGNWMVDVPDRANIDSRFKFTVFSQGDTAYGSSYKIRWENDKNESGTREVTLTGDELCVEEGKWLQKLNIDGGALVGTWKCVGWVARSIGTFVFFNEDGSGFWLVKSPDRGKIDLKIKFFVDQRDDTHFTIHWSTERAEDGTVNIVLINDKLFVDDVKDGSNKLWLQKLNKEDEENEKKKSEKKSLFSCCCPGKKETITYKKK